MSLGTEAVSQPGRRIELSSWKVTEESVRQYLRAVGDTLPVYFEYGLAPPMSLAACALGSLLQQLALPPGAIHSLQEVETLRPIRLKQEVRGTAYLGRTKRRGAMEFVTAGYSLEDGAGRLVQRGKSTVLVAHSDPAYPGDNAQAGSASAAQGRAAYTSGPNNNLPVVMKAITQDQLDAYARVSGDHNPLHRDAGFAASTQFGGIIAHGMLTLAFVSEMMASAFGLAWLETGALKVKFKGAAYLEDRVETWGHVTKEETLSQRRLAVCAVGVRNCHSGQELISGTATARLESHQTAL